MGGRPDENFGGGIDGSWFQVGREDGDGCDYVVQWIQSLDRKSGIFFMYCEKAVVCNSVDYFSLQNVRNRTVNGDMPGPLPFGCGMNPQI